MIRSKSIVQQLSSIMPMILIVTQAAMSQPTNCLAQGFDGDQRPPIVSKDPDDGSIVITVYDIIKVRSSLRVGANVSEVLADPAWSGKRKRPVDIKDMDSILIRRYDAKKRRGGIGYAPDQIMSIIYWEQLADADTRRWLAKYRTEQSRGEQRMARIYRNVAEALVSRLERINSDWARTRQLRASIETYKTLEKLNAGAVEQALIEFESLRKRFPSDQFLEKEFVATLMSLAERALGAEDPDKSDQYLQQAERAYPNNQDLRDLRREWNQEARQLVDRAEQLEKTQSGDAIASAQRAVRMSTDPTLRRRARIVIRNAEGLIIASYEDPGVFEPFNATRPIEQQLVHLMYDFIMERNDTSTIYGPSGLMLGIKSSSLGSKLSLKLNSQRRFSDGSPITAADVVQTINLLRDARGEGHDSEWARFVMDAKQVSPFELTVNVNPHPRPDSLLYLPVVSRQVYRSLPRRGDRNSRSAKAVSGPFRLSEVNADGDIRLVANRNYREQLQLGKITFKRYVQRGIGQAVGDLRQGRIHMISDPSPTQIEQIRSTPGQFVTRRIESNSVWALAVNHESRIFSDQLNPRGASAARDLRRAVSLAIDRDGILNQYFNLGGRANFSHAAVTGPFPRQSKAYDPTFELAAGKPAAANAITARYGDVISQRQVVLKYADQGDAVEDAMAQIKRELEDAGFSVDLQKRPGNAFARELRRGFFDLAYFQIKHDNVLFNIANLFDSSPEARESGANFMKYNNQELSQLFEDLRGEKVADVIWAIQNKIHRFVGTELVLIPLWQLDSHVAFSRRLVGRTEQREVTLPIDSSHIFRSVEKWYLKPQSN